MPAFGTTRLRPWRPKQWVLAGLLFAAIGGATCRAQAPERPELVFIAPTSNTLPLAEFEGNRLRAGILKDLGEAIAARLQRRARFLPLPSRRVRAALRDGEADGLCYVIPGWLDGQHDWSSVVIPDAALLAGTQQAPELAQLQELEGQAIGTVVGYRYPEVEALLGAGFVRDDAPTMLANLRKLAAQRLPYALAERTSLAYFLRQHPEAGLRTVLTLGRIDARCAFSRKARLPFGQVNQAIDDLLADGSVERILSRYR